MEEENLEVKLNNALKKIGEEIEKADEKKKISKSEPIPPSISTQIDTAFSSKDYNLIKSTISKARDEGINPNLKTRIVNGLINYAHKKGFHNYSSIDPIVLATKLDPGNNNLKRDLMIIYKNTYNINKAKALLKDTLDKNPDDMYAKSELVNILHTESEECERRSDIMGAIACYLEIIDYVDIHNSETYKEKLAGFFVRQGSYDRAEEMLELNLTPKEKARKIKILYDNAVPYEMKKSSKTSLADYFSNTSEESSSDKEKIEILEEALKIDKNCSSAKNKLSDIYSNKADEALREAESLNLRDDTVVGNNILFGQKTAGSQNMRKHDDLMKEHKYWFNKYKNITGGGFF